jgi:hypothetical protein
VLVFGKQFNHRLGTLRTADQERITHGFNTETGVPGAAQKSYTVHNSSFSSRSVSIGADPERIFALSAGAFAPSAASIFDGSVRAISAWPLLV